MVCCCGFRGRGHLCTLTLQWRLTSCTPNPTCLPGEYCELLVGSEAGRLLEGEEPLSTTEGEVVGVLEEVLQRSCAGDGGQQAAPVRAVVLTALAKAATRFPASAGRIKGLLAAHAGSLDLETQTRSVEYGRLFKYSALTPQAGAVLRC